MGLVELNRSVAGIATELQEVKPPVRETHSGEDHSLHKSVREIFQKTGKSGNSSDSWTRNR